MVDQSLARVLVFADAISANAAILASRELAFIADVSFDGYGHGAERAARAALAGGAAGLSVADDEEAAALTAVGIPGPILLGHVSTALDLYGLGVDAAFASAMRVSAPVLGTKTIEAGEGVSYGYTYRATRHTNLAMIGIGYADGLDRSASNRGSVLLGGALRPVAGRVAMNVLMIDLGDDSCELGAEAVVFGPERRAAEWAKDIDRPSSAVAVEFGLKVGVAK
jgi:alanine racemase